MQFSLHTYFGILICGSRSPTLGDYVFVRISCFPLGYILLDHVLHIDFVRYPMFVLDVFASVSSVIVNLHFDVDGFAGCNFLATISSCIFIAKNLRRVDIHVGGVVLFSVCIP